MLVLQTHGNHEPSAPISQCLQSLPCSKLPWDCAISGSAPLCPSSARDLCILYLALGATDYETRSV